MLETIEDVRKKANEAIAELIEDLIDTRKEVVGSGNCPKFYCGQSCNSENQECEDCKEQFYNEMRDELLKQYSIPGKAKD